MERIIIDTFFKKKTPCWNETNPKNQKDASDFNRRIQAVNRMYGWLEEKGILKEIAFRYTQLLENGEIDTIDFAVDVNKLLPYREAMEQSRIEDANIAVYAIFDADISPCRFCGGIELTWVMSTYRNNSGCVSRSHECYRCRDLRSEVCYEIGEYKRKAGSIATIDKYWDVYEKGYDWSILTKGEHHGCSKS